MTQMLTVPRAKIKLVEGLNARKVVEDNDLVTLRHSVKRQGILVPLIVQENGDGYKLVAGHRRLRVAELEDLAEVPVHVLAPGEDAEQVEQQAAEATATENMQRQQLDPVEEARALKTLVDSGLTVKGAADAVGFSEKVAKDRLLILDLPEKVQAHVAAGELSVKDVPPLADLAKASAKLCEAAVAFHIKGDAYASDSWDQVATRAVGSNQGAHGLWSASTVGGSYGAGGAHGEFTKTRKGGSWAKKLKLDKDTIAHMEAMKTKEHGYEQHYKLTIDEDLLTEAVNVGTAWGTVDTHYPRVVYLDPKAYADAVTRMVKADWQAWENAKEQAKADKTTAKKDEDLTPQQLAEREYRKHVREAQVTARGINLELGAKLSQVFATQKWNGDTAEVLIDLVLGHDTAYGDMGGGQWSELTEYALAGLRMVLPEFQEEVQPKSPKGKVKIKYMGQRSGGKDADRKEFVAKVRKWFDAAKTPEAKLGKLMMVLAAAEFARLEAIPRGQRIGDRPFGSVYDNHGERWDGGMSKKALASLKKLAGRALTPGYEKFVKGERSARNKHDKAVRAGRGY